MNRLKKIIFLVLIVLLFVTVNFNTVYAGDIFQQGEDWIHGSTDDSLDIADASEGLENLAGLLWGIGLFVVLVSAAVIGIRFMLSGVSQRAEILQSLMPYLIGAVIIFGALTIWKVLIEILDGSI